MNDKVINRTELLKSFEQLKTQFSQALVDAKAKDQSFEELRRSFYHNLTSCLKEAQQKLPQQNPLAQEVNRFVNLLAKTNDEWDKKIAGRDKGIAFRQNFNDSLLVFVYGKVKSGKSSLGNYVAWGHTDPGSELKQSVPAHLLPSYFSHDCTRVEGGDADKEAELKKEFRVGATEATSSIQGFRLSGLTWIDSPGLHSVHGENGQLARDYVEHADLILYTMKSDAPGRETDLEEIRELLDKEKKVVLLLTGSDTTEEDEDANGNIVQMVVMKSHEIRAKQREYVRQAVDKLNHVGTKKVDIISFSARYAQEHEKDLRLFDDSGMGQFFGVLSELIQAEGVAMKKRVPMTNFKNFMSDCVRDIVPYRALLADFEQTIENLQSRLPKNIAVAQSNADLAVREVVEREFALIAQLPDDRKQSGVQSVQQTLTQECQKIANQFLEKVFVEIVSDFRQAINQNFVSSELVKLPEFSVEMQDHQVATVVTATRKRTSGWGSLLGGLGGAFLGGPIGAAIGAITGGTLGAAMGRSGSVSYRTISLPAGDNFQEIRHTAITAYTNVVKTQIAQNAEQVVSQVLQDAKKLLQDLNHEVQHMESQLQNLHSEVDRALTLI